MILAGFATQTPFEIVLGYLMVALFILCISLALHSLYEKIAKYFASFRPRDSVNITVEEMYVDGKSAKETGPPHPDVKGKVK